MKIPLRHLYIIHSDLPGDAVDSSLYLIERNGDVRLHNDVADAVAQKNLHSDARIGNLGICEIHDGSGDAITQLVGMGRVDFFKHNDSPSQSKSPGGFSSEAPAHFS